MATARRLGCFVVVPHAMDLALGRCVGCGARIRVLPCDVLPRKRYGLPVIEYTLVRHALDNRSLRRVVLDDLGGARTPAHTTLHAWSEGVGAYVLGRPAGEVDDATPASRIVADVEAHDRRARRAFERPLTIDPRRYRSEARRERLAAGAHFLRLALALDPELPDAVHALTQLHRRVLTWGATCGLGFRTGLRSTSMEHPPPTDPPHSPANPQTTEDPACTTRGRSPPGATK